MEKFIEQVEQESAVEAAEEEPQPVKPEYEKVDPQAEVEFDIGEPNSFYIPSNPDKQWKCDRCGREGWGWGMVIAVDRAVAEEFCMHCFHDLIRRYCGKVKEVINETEGD